MTLVHKGVVTLLGVGLIVACSAGERASEHAEPSLSPAMQRALSLLASVPVSSEGDVVPSGHDEPGDPGGTSFGEAPEGAAIIEAMGARGPTGTGAGYGGVGGPTGGLVGGVGDPSIPAGGVGDSTLETGGVATAGGLGGHGELGLAVCDFVGALCHAAAACTGTRDLSCGYNRVECAAFVQEILEAAEVPLSLPPEVTARLRCMTARLESAGCLSDAGVRTAMRACGIPHVSP
jgi:hypothetical protein